ncbi:unnamed protein product [Mytilus coruscus]|uniref:Uncharacterized protein n=1 Tax=Mytilus coruscus TaxID=42192 RepID=A0A6J8EXL2_MYTCO|nr:unnamed protein product [Mytilus coruscus]
MDLRERKVLPVVKEKKEVTPKTLRMRKYRDKINTTNASKYEDMKKKDRERKPAEREIDGEKRFNDEDHPLDTNKRSTRKQSTNSTNKQILENEINKRAVLRTQNWRLKIKLTETELDNSSNNKRTADEDDDDTISPPGSSRSSEWRSTKKAKAAMPETPRRKSRVLTKLINSPRTRKELEKKGVVHSKHVVRQLEVGKAVMNTISNII